MIDGVVRRVTCPVLACAPMVQALRALARRARIQLRSPAGEAVPDGPPAQAAAVAHRLRLTG
jgi:hypothetical protein